MPRVDDVIERGGRDGVGALRLGDQNLDQLHQHSLAAYWHGAGHRQTRRDLEVIINVGVHYPEGDRYALGRRHPNEPLNDAVHEIDHREVGAVEPRWRSGVGGAVRPRR